jgi:hypothetical protein
MRTMLAQGSAAWVDSAEAIAPYQLLRKYVEGRLDRPVRTADMLPE